MQVVLTVVSGPRTGVKVRIRDKTAITMGRSKTTDFHVLDGAMSRVHAVVALGDDGWYVEDQKSRNGTWIDGRSIERETIRDGDVFLLGRDTAVRFEIDVEADDAQSSSGGFTLPSCTQCGNAIGSAVDMVRAADGRPYHMGCRNMDHLTGTELGEFKVAEKLPPLGDAFFFRAHQPSLNRSVMLEVFDPPLTARPGYREALLEEVRHVSRFLHPNILQIFGFEEARGMSIVVMEYFPTEKLSTVLEQRRFVKVRGAVQVAVQMIEALRYARDHGGAVPYLTTEVVLVSQAHQAKVKLFKDPLEAKRVTTAREAAYIAPEVFNNEHAGDDKSLVYSVGAILYHMLAGIPPYEGETAAEVVRRAQNESPPALRRINLKVSPALAAAVEAAIQVNREARPASLDDLLDRLRSAG